MQGENVGPGPAVRFDYVRFRADGVLEVGSTNCMRLRGIAIFEGAAARQRAQCEIAFRGFRITSLPGDTMPRGRFELERAGATGG